MSKKSKAERRAIVKELKRKEEENAFAEKPIPNGDLKALFEHLETALAGEENGKRIVLCDHTLNKSRAFLQARGIQNIEEICEWFGEYGGFCDCEVTYNVTDYWEERI
ncbi:hypothetical protein DDZ13_08220 [Coraliomargarita sinensis]|uniref:DUF2695 domain-containing protein n=1 Tax=Coraliomargarita sinensis TaxID=2174842 RepID=A0A317ZKZ3_9BACT|nr:DUF2695 domain-containing protein [Coraliomargarita sinensis]PXA04021.1 hypothetical protein DDZ13_08220 [Coraliomargarita sinensis]